MLDLFHDHKLELKLSFQSIQLSPQAPHVVSANKYRQIKLSHMLYTTCVRTKIDH